jgi:hypothetical protein
MSRAKNDVPETLRGKKSDLMLDERASTHPDKGFWNRSGEWQKARSQSAG